MWNWQKEKLPKDAINRTDVSVARHGEVIVNGVNVTALQKENNLLRDCLSRCTGNDLATDQERHRLLKGCGE